MAGRKTGAIANAVLAEANWQGPLPEGWEFEHKVAEFATAGLISNFFVCTGKRPTLQPDVPTLLRNRPVPNCTPCRDHGAVLLY